MIPHPVKKGFNYVIDFRNDGRLDQVEILDANFDGTNKVTFDYLGSPYNGGSPRPSEQRGRHAAVGNDDQDGERGARHWIHFRVELSGLRC